MIKILSTGLNYPYVSFSTRREETSDYSFYCYIEQSGSGDYVANLNTSIMLSAPDDETASTLCIISNETNYEMKVYDETYGKTYTLAPRGGSKTFVNQGEQPQYYNITYTSPNPPPKTVDVQAIVMG